MNAHAGNLQCKTGQGATISFYQEITMVDIPSLPTHVRSIQVTPNSYFVPNLFLRYSSTEAASSPERAWLYTRTSLISPWK
jgi:hypothetical protein